MWDDQQSDLVLLSRDKVQVSNNNVIQKRALFIHLAFTKQEHMFELSEPCLGPTRGGVSGIWELIGGEVKVWLIRAERVGFRLLSGIKEVKDEVRQRLKDTPLNIDYWCKRSRKREILLLKPEG